MINLLLTILAKEDKNEMIDTQNERTEKWDLAVA